MGNNTLGISFDRVNLYKKALDGSWSKNKAILNNIANVNTPHYKKQIVDFQSVLKAELDKDSEMKMNRTNERHLSSGGVNSDFTPIRQEDFSARQDENNVNIDTEVAELTENAIMYDILSRDVNGVFKKWKMVIEEGGR